MSSSGGGGSSGVQNRQTEVVVPDWVQAQVQNNINTANNLASIAYQAPPTPTVAPLSADTQSAIADVEGLQGSWQPAFSQASSTIANLPQSIQSLLSPYLPGQEQTAVQQIQRQGALTGQQIAAQAVQAGALGGTRYGVQRSLNDSQVQQQIAQAVNQISSGGFNQAANAAFTSAGDEAQLASANLTAQLTGIGALGTAGSQQQALNQAQLNAALQQWQQQQQYPYQQLAIQQSTLAGSPYGNTTTSTQPTTGNALLSDLGLATSVIPAAYNVGKWTGLWGSSAAAPAAAGDSSMLAADTSGAMLDLYGYGAAGTAATAADVGAGAAAAGTAADVGAGAAAAGGAAAGKGAADVAPVVLAAA